MIIYFCLVLIGRNNNVCLGVCMKVFMRIVSIKRGFVMVFMCIVTFKNYF